MTVDHLRYVGIFLVVSWVPLAFVITPEKSIWFAVMGGIIMFLTYFDKKERDKEKLIAKEDYLNNALKNLKDFDSTQYFISVDLSNLIAIDENSKKVCFIENEKEPYIYSYKDLLKSEIVEDGVSVTDTSRGSQVGGALLGGLLAGGAGAVIGGLSASKSTTNKVRSIKLNLVVNDTVNPFFTIVFMEIDPTQLPVEKNYPYYNSHIDKANHWHSLISVLINQADMEDKENAKNSEVKVINSVADEIAKLAELHKQGILTQDEFNEQKKRMLS